VALLLAAEAIRWPATAPEAANAPAALLVDLAPQPPVAPPAPVPAPPAVAPPRPAARPESSARAAPARAPDGAAPPPAATTQTPAAPPAEPQPPAVPRPPRHDPDDAGNDGFDAYAALVWDRVQARRPAARRFSGTTEVRFQVATDGTLHSAAVTRSSGSGLHDRAALTAVEGAAPFPPPPATLAPGRLDFVVSFVFQ